MTLTFDHRVVNYARAAQWSPTDQNWSVADNIVDDLVPVENSNRVGFPLSFQEHA